MHCMVPGGRDAWEKLIPRPHPQICYTMLYIINLKDDSFSKHTNNKYFAFIFPEVLKIAQI